MPESITPINSVPALAAAIRTTGFDFFAPTLGKSLAFDALVPMYRVRNSTLENEVEDAVRLVDETSERLRRLATAYGEWHDFDASAYFDLTDKQVRSLVKISERVSSVHVIFRTDLLLPAFRWAVTYWAGQFSAAYAAFQAEYRVLASDSVYDDDFLLDTQPVMAARWQRLQTTIETVGQALADDPGFLGMSAKSEAQMAVRQWWKTPPVNGIMPDLTPHWMSLPTLTLSYDFPLPPHRQSGRTRRLRNNRDRQRRFSLGSFGEN